MAQRTCFMRSRIPMFSAILLILAITRDCTHVHADEIDEFMTTAATDVGDYEIDEDATASDSDEFRDLELVEKMSDQSIASGAKVQFKCKVSGSSKTPLTFTWYKDNTLIEPLEEIRATIKDREWGSRLLITDIYTVDAGVYRCEASDGVKSVHTSARLTVRLNRPPDIGGSAIDTTRFQGKCEIYKGYTCAEYLDGKFIYVDSFQKQEEMEKLITAALTLVGNEEKVSGSCSKYARPAFCYFVFPLCERKAEDPGNGNDENYDDDYDFSNVNSIVESEDDFDTVDDYKPNAIRLCREDCELLRHQKCRKEFTSDDPLIQQLVENADCSRLPRTTATGAKCTRLGLSSAVDNTHLCYNETGVNYRGVVSTPGAGSVCRMWPSKMLAEYPELSGGHNFCRNPGNIMDQPWCYTDRSRSIKEACSIPKCKAAAPGGPSVLLMILIPCVSIPVLIGCIMLVMCFVCRKGKDKDTKHQPGKKVEMKSLSVKKTQIAEIPATSLHFLMELGEGKFGKVYKAQILNNALYCPQEPVAAKTLSAGSLQAQVGEFQREMEVFSELQHPNVSCLKAAVLQPSLRCMIFEYTSRVDLHELLTLHSPHSDIGGGKIVSSASSQTSGSLESADFLHMAVQIASGLEYLASRNFVHRDLAARNILACDNNVMKISNLGVVRDCYLTSYYRSPQGGHMLPVRWMAPESLNGNQFSEKSVVWSFGVLIWEMFSFGMQPFCGYNNHEVIDMIARGQTLSCPDQCSSRVYSLMHECWARDPAQRPTFKDIHAKLSGWEGTSTTRMTSQLAQGIHRQLTNVMREGGQLGQYSPPQGLVVDGFNNPPYMATSPPQPGPPHASPASQAYYTSPSATSSSGIISNQPPPSYPAYIQQQQMYQQQPLMYPQPQMHYNRPHPSSYPYKSSHTHSSSRSTDSCASSVRNQYIGNHARMPQHDPNQIPTQPQYPAPHQGIHALKQQPEYENLQRTPDSGVHSTKDADNQNPVIDPPSSPSTSSSGPALTRPRPGSEVLSTVTEGPRPPLSVYTTAPQSAAGNNLQVSNQLKPLVAPKPPMSPVDTNRTRNVGLGVSGQRNRNHNNHLEGDSNEVRKRLNSSEVQFPSTSPGRPQSGKLSNRPGMTSPNKQLDAPEVQKQRNSSASGEHFGGKAMSCDSGLPGDEPDAEPAENQPFLSQQANGRISYRQAPPLLLPPGSASSSVSGSTAVTTETRLTS